MKLIQAQAAIILQTYLPPHIMQMVFKKKKKQAQIAAKWIIQLVHLTLEGSSTQAVHLDISRPLTFLKIFFENRALLLKLLFKLYMGQQYYLKCK